MTSSGHGQVSGDGEGVVAGGAGVAGKRKTVNQVSEELPLVYSDDVAVRRSKNVSRLIQRALALSHA